MANTDALSLFPTTMPGATANTSSAAGSSSSDSNGGGDAKKGDALSLFPTTMPGATTTTTTKQQQPPALPSVSEYGDLGNAWWNTQANPPANQPATSVITSRSGAPITTAASGPDVNALLQPAPNTIYGDVIPLAKDTQTGQFRIALPNMIRSPLLGLTGGVGANALTIDENTGAVRLTPEAQAAGSVVANPLQFSKDMPLVRGAAPTFGKPPPVTVDELAAAINRADKGTPAPTEGETPAYFTGATGDQPRQPGATAQTPPGTPQPVGAQVTMPGAATLTPAEVDAYRATAEGKKLLENQVIGEPDRTAYIPASNPNLAEQEQTVNTSRELKSLGVTSPEASQEAKLAAQANNDARTAYWQDTAKSPVDVQKAEADRAAQAEADLKATWANKTDADASPVIDTANAIKASPDGRRPAVRSAVDSITSELTDANGNLITDPEQLYGVRKHIDDLLSKEGQRETPLAARATASLQALKDQLDTVIEASAPGFKQYLKNFSDASKGIDEMQVLQDAESKLFRGPNSTMQYSDFQRFMKNVVDMRNAQGVNPYKSISDDTMQRLWNLRDDLRRSAGAQELARASGSDTAPNIIDALKQYAKLGGATAVDAAAAHIFGPTAGPMISRGLRAATAPIMAQRQAASQMTRMRQMLYPQNPLNQPPP